MQFSVENKQLQQREYTTAVRKQFSPIYIQVKSINWKVFCYEKV